MTDLLRQASLLIRRAIIRLENRMAQQTTRRKDVPPDEATQIDRRLASLNARLNAALYLLVRQVQVMDAQSIPSARDRRFIESHLKTRAMLPAGRIELERSSMDGLWDRIRANQNKAELRAQLKLERAGFDRLVTSLKATIQMMGALDMDPALMGFLETPVQPAPPCGFQQPRTARPLDRLHPGR